MVPKAVSVAGNPSAGKRLFILAATAILLLCRQGTAQKSQAPPTQNAFAKADASALLNQMKQGLIVRQAKLFLASFDLAQMSDGQLFRQQVQSFISHTDSIRIHFNVTRAAMEGDKGFASADVEMEADTGSSTVPLYKQASLNFTAERVSSGWKFIDIQPRSFFSLSQGGSGAPYSSSQ